MSKTSRDEQAMSNRRGELAAGVPTRSEFDACSTRRNMVELAAGVPTRFSIRRDKQAASNRAWPAGRQV